MSTPRPRTRHAPVWLLTALALLLSAFFASPATAQEPDDGPVVDILELSGPIDPPTVDAIHDLLTDAAERGSELVVLQLDAPAGVAVDVQEVVRSVEASEVPVAVLVTGEAVGAGAYLYAAAHIRAVLPDATVGPACPVTVSLTCSDDDRSRYADLWTRDGSVTPEVAEALNDRVLSGGEAHADLEVRGIEPLLVELDGRDVTTASGERTLRIRSDEVTVRLHKLGLLRRTLHAALTPTFVYLLLIATLLLLLFEVFQPGFGVAGVAGLLLAPLAIYGLVVLPVAWWALALVIVGLVLLAIDLAIAGLGIPTAAGTVALAVGSWQLFAVDAPLLRLSPWVIGPVVLGCVVFFVAVMTVVLRAQAGPGAGAELGEHLVGKVGIVRSTMNPEGHVFVDGALWRARWTSADRGRVKTGTQVRVEAIDGPVLVVGDIEVDEPVGPSTS